MPLNHILALKLLKRHSLGPQKKKQAEDPMTLKIRSEAVHHDQALAATVAVLLRSAVVPSKEADPGAALVTGPDLGKGPMLATSQNSEKNHGLAISQNLVINLVLVTSQNLVINLVLVTSQNSEKSHDKAKSPNLANGLTFQAMQKNLPETEFRKLRAQK